MSFVPEDSPTDNPAIISTFEGVSVLPETLAQQGSSPRVGDFTGLKGASVEEIISRVPKEWKMVGQDDGRGVKFMDDSVTERIRLHGPEDAPPPGSNSASGWVLRIMDRNKKC